MTTRMKPKDEEQIRSFLTKIVSLAPTATDEWLMDSMLRTCEVAYGMGRFDVTMEQLAEVNKSMAEMGK